LRDSRVLISRIGSESIHGKETFSLRSAVTVLSMRGRNLGREVSDGVCTRHFPLT